MFKIILILFLSNVNFILFIYFLLFIFCFLLFDVLGPLLIGPVWAQYIGPFLASFLQAFSPTKLGPSRPANWAHLVQSQRPRMAQTATCMAISSLQHTRPWPCPCPRHELTLAISAHNARLYQLSRHLSNGRLFQQAAPVSSSFCQGPNGDPTACYFLPKKDYIAAPRPCTYPASSPHRPGHGRPCSCNQHARQQCPLHQASVCASPAMSWQ